MEDGEGGGRVRGTGRETGKKRGRGKGKGIIQMAGGRAEDKGGVAMVVKESKYRVSRMLILTDMNIYIITSLFVFVNKACFHGYY